MAAPALALLFLAAEKAAEATVVVIAAFGTALGLYKGGEAIYNEMSKADEEAEKKSDAGAIDAVCSTCPQIGRAHV